MQNTKIIQNILQAAAANATTDQNFKLAEDLNTVNAGVRDLLREKKAKPNPSLGWFQNEEKKLVYRRHAQNDKGYYTRGVPFDFVRRVWLTMILSIALYNTPTKKALDRKLLEKLVPGHPTYKYQLIIEWVETNHWRKTTPMSTLDDAFKQLPQEPN